MKERIIVPESEMLRQREFMRLVEKLEQRPRSYHIVSMGCQMNERDSESVAGMLEAMGMSRADVREEADLILYNTCCVRENAENKALGNVIWLKELKKDKPDLMICVGGCMTQEKGMAAMMKKRYPFIDLIYGTHNLYRLPEYVWRVLTERRPVVEVMDTDGEVVEGMPERRRNRFNAFVNIMYGCNNFCTYCIVPYVRGRERSRTPEAVIAECVRLQDEGAQEIMLLGQNVNSYRGGGAEFAELLYRIDRLGIPRIRFMTSHPKDISEELIRVMASAKHVCHSLHLPAQHGDDRVLAAMNRRYTRKRYLEIVSALREAIPDIALSTDLIVGYPGETEEAFEETMRLVREVRFDSAFTFVYSPRPGTPAAKLPDQIPAEVSTERIQRLIALQKQITRERLGAAVGKTQRVLVTGHSRRDASWLAGKNEYNVTVNFPGDARWIGQFADVAITSCGESTLRGELLGGQAE